MAKSKSGKAKLYELMHAVPEAKEIFETIFQFGEKSWESDTHRDRTTAIMSAAYLEYALLQAITYHLQPDQTDPALNYLFRSDEAPYRELAGRTRLARALGILSAEEFENIEIIRLVRNAFAHTKSPITFQTLEIANYLDKFHDLPGTIGYEEATKRFAEVYTLLGAATADKANRMAFAKVVFALYFKLSLYRWPTTSSPN